MPVTASFDGGSGGSTEFPGSEVSARVDRRQKTPSGEIALQGVISHSDTKPTPLRLPLRVSLMVAATAFAISAQAQAPKGWLGFVIAIESEGWAPNPTLRSVIIKEIAAGSAAAAQRIVPGDQILEFDGLHVVGPKRRICSLISAKRSASHCASN